MLFTITLRQSGLTVFFIGSFSFQVAFQLVFKFKERFQFLQHLFAKRGNYMDEDQEKKLSYEQGLLDYQEMKEYDYYIKKLEQQNAAISGPFSSITEKMGSSFRQKIKDNKRQRRSTDTSSQRQIMVDNLVDDTQIKDENEKSQYDNVILHKYMHPVEQFMIEEDSKFFNDHLDNQMVVLLNDIMKHEKEAKDTNQHNDSVLKIRDRLVTHLNSFKAKDQDEKPDNALMASLKAKLKSKVEDKK